MARTVLVVDDARTLVKMLTRSRWQAYADLGRRVTKPPVELLAPNQPS